LLVLCGHQRSGTTLLRILCNRHPDMAVTNEFASLLQLGRPYPRYMVHILRTWWRTRGRKDIFNPGGRRRFAPARNLAFTLSYLAYLGAHWRKRIGPEDVHAAMHGIFPQARVVGDKYPDYIWSLDRFVQMPSLSCIVIYRDCRDVASSVLEQVRTSWKGRRFASQMDTADKVAQRWVKAIEVMERNVGRLHILRYESLIERPRQELEAFGGKLDVDPGKFPIQIIRRTSIGKHREGLTPEDLETVMGIAGPTLQRLGYL
jgi:hypothetical protein